MQYYYYSNSLIRTIFAGLVLLMFVMTLTQSNLQIVESFVFSIPPSSSRQRSKSTFSWRVNRPNEIFTTAMRRMSGNDAENNGVSVKDLYRTVAREDPEWFENYVLDVLMDDICDKNDDDDRSFMMELVELAKQSKLEKRQQQQRQQQKAAESKKENQQQQKQQQVIPTQSNLNTEKPQNDIQSNEEIVTDVMQSVETSPIQDSQAAPPTAPPDLTAQHQEEINYAKKSLTAETQRQNTSTIGETLVKSDTGLEEKISIADNASVVLEIADQSNGQLKPNESSPIESTIELVQEENIVEYKDDQNKANSVKEHATDHTLEHDTTSQQSTPRLADSNIPENTNEPKTVEPPPKVVEQGLDRTVATTSLVAEKTVPSVTADKAVENNDDDSYVVLYRGAYNGSWKQVNLTTLIALGYSREDIIPLEMDALDLIVREKIKRPRTGVPSRWKTAPTSSSVGASERKRGDVIRIVKRSEAEELRLVPTDDEEDYESRSTRSTSRSNGPTGQKRSSEHIQVTTDDPPTRREPRNKVVKDVTMPEADRLRGDRVAPVEDVRRRPIDKNRDTVRERKGQDPDDGEIPNRKPKAETGVAERRSPAVRVRDRKVNDSVAAADRQRDPLPKKNADDDDDVLSGRDRLDSQEGRTRTKPNDERERVPREKRRERAPQEDKERRVYSVWQEPQKKKQIIKDPPPPNSKFWPDIDTFRSLLRNEAGLRLRILGDDWKDVVKEESDWRLNLYKEWLWTLHHGVGEPFVESRSDRMRRQGSKRPEAPAPRKQKSRNE